MLENELVLVIRFEDNGVLIEAFDFASQRYPRHQVNCRLVPCLSLHCSKIHPECFEFVFP